ncbi:MAG: sulfatase-like hydrolase/transferase, partial [Bacillota bacterium]
DLVARYWGLVSLVDKYVGNILDKLEELGLDDNTIVVYTSDHGNIEDIGVKTHTYNKVPAILISRKEGIPELQFESLLDVTPNIMRIFEAESEINR